MLDKYPFVFCISFILLFVMRNTALSIGLVDKPDSRKLHQGLIPLVGGISIYIALLISSAIFISELEQLWLYFTCGGILIVLGIFDDYFDVNFKIKLIVQIVIAIIVICLGEYSLNNLGYIFGNQNIELSSFWSVAITIFAVLGAINAFNMIDGIDGLLGGLTIVTFSCLGMFFYISAESYLSSLCFMIVAAVIPYFLLNIGIPFGQKYKVFMGDAGSMFLGFMTILILVCATQCSHDNSLKPVTALWLIAVPLMDMVTVMFRRLWHGNSPFKADRQHLHHIFQRAGFSQNTTLLVICLFSLVCALFGIFADINGMKESSMFVLFLLVFGLYLCVVNSFVSITHWVRKKKLKASNTLVDGAN